MKLGELLREVLGHFELENQDFPPGRTHPESFFLVAKWYIKDLSLFDLFLDIFCKGTISDTVELKTGTQGEGNDAEISQLAVIRAIHYWVTQFSEDFRFNHMLTDRLNKFQDQLQQDGKESMADLLSLDDMPELPWFSSVPQTPAGPPSGSHPLNKPSRKQSIAFDNMTAEELSDTLLAIDLKYFRRIPFQEFHLYALAVGPTDHTPHITDLINFFNGLSRWVQSVVLRQKASATRRAKTIIKLITTASELVHLGSLNTALAVVGGLQSTAIRRLSVTWSEIAKQKIEELDSLTDMFSMSSNFAKYRQKTAKIKENKTFLLPVLCIVLKDLCAIHANGGDLVKDPDRAGQLRMDKYDNLVNIFSYIKYSKQKYPSTKVDIDFTRILRAAVVHIQMTDDTLMEISLSLESKEATKDTKDWKVEGGSSNILSFADWASKKGQSTNADPETIQRNVEKMVDAVFRMYSKDQSGDSLTINEFQALQSNFPFIENFSELDENHDGMITRDEMLQYFLRANQQLREYFKHNFAEHTFLSRATCEQCGGMLSGLVKQGVKCKDCGIVCHKECKEWVVVDCRKGKNNRKSRKIRRNTANPSLDTASVYTDDDQFDNISERLTRAEEARDLLAAEVGDLKRENIELKSQIQALQQHITQIRKHTISFILEQMSTLSLQTDTEV